MPPIADILGRNPAPIPTPTCSAGWCALALDSREIHNNSPQQIIHLSGFNPQSANKHPWKLTTSLVESWIKHFLPLFFGWLATFQRGKPPPPEFSQGFCTFFSIFWCPKFPRNFHLHHFALQTYVAAKTLPITLPKTNMEPQNPHNS